MLHTNFASFPTLATNRLILRALQSTDRETLVELRSNEIVNRHLDRAKTITTEDADSFIKKIEAAVASKQSFYWAITTKDSDRLIGTICLFNLNHDKSWAEIGYELLPEFHGRGIMHEAVAAVIRFVFTQVNARTLIALTTAGNKKSIALLLRHKFKPDTSFEYTPAEESNHFTGYYLLKENAELGAE